MILAITFLHPGLLWGLPLITVPIILHLLFRRRAVRRPWAAIELLQRAIDRTRRRRRFEEWLVLLLRCLAMLALVLLIARPLSGPILGSSGTHRVFVIDDSRSMELVGSNASSFEISKRAIRNEIERAIERDRGERITVLTTSAPDEPLVEGLSVGDEAIARLDRRLDALETRSGSLDHDAVLRALKVRVESIAETGIRIDWFTDFLAHDWPTDRVSALESLLEDTEGHSIEFVVRRVENPRSQNLGVVSIDVESRRIVTGVSIPIVVALRNDGPSAFAGGIANIELDGLRSTPVDVPELGPGESIELDLSIAFDRPGPHSVSIELPGDRYAPDDRRWLVLDLQETTRVVIVDGEPDERARRSETWMLRAAIDPTDDAQHAVDLRLTDRSRLPTWTEEDWQAIDLLAFCDVSGIDPETRSALARFVEAGGGVLVFTGDLSSAETLQQEFFDGPLAWLRVRATGEDGDPESPHAIDLGTPTHPMFDQDPELWRRIFGSLIRVGRWTRFEIDPEAGLEVPLRIANPRGDPLYFGRVRDDGGAAFVCATSADDSWNNLGAHPALLAIAQHALENATRRPTQFSQNLAAADRIVIDVDLGRFLSRVELVDPEDGSTVASGDAVPDDADTRPTGRLVGRWSIEPSQLDHEGLFALRLREHGGTESTRLVARNTDADEGRFEPASPESFLAAIDAGVVDRVRIEPAVSESGTEAASRAGGPWRILAGLALLLLLAESGWTALRGGPTA